MNTQIIWTFCQDQGNHAFILGDYEGVYSLGIVLDDDDNLAISVRVNDKSRFTFPTHVNIDDQRVKIVVEERLNLTLEKEA